MVKLIKQPKPQVLVQNGAAWTKDLMILINNGSKVPDNIKGKYRHLDIKVAVRLETKEKCAYCESLVAHLYPGDIEHIIPKSVYPRLTFTWDNLTFVCYLCNNHKRDTVDKTCKLLNPYKDNIDDHLRAFGPIIMHINNSKRGEITWKEINLNRKEVRERRLDAIKELQNLIDKYNCETSPGLKTILKQEIINQTTSDNEYSFCLRQYAQDQGVI